MEINNISDDKTECDKITALELQKSKQILYFSDGILEELSESDGEDVGHDMTDRNMNVNINLTTLTLGHRIIYQAYQIGSRLLHAVDCVGEGLASFFGITGPKYLSDSDIEHVAEAEPQIYDNISQSNDSVSWHHNNINASNIVITRFFRDAVNNAP